MRHLPIIISLLMAFLIFKSQIIQAQSSLKSKDSYGYWKEKMSDPDQNFNALVEEFDNYWKNNNNRKGSGYKQFKRWQHYWQGDVRQDGKLPTPEYLKEQFNYAKNNFENKQVVGDWTYVGYSSNPEPLYAGHGRLTCLAFHPTSSDIIYVGSPAGGLWKSTSGGNNWQVCGTEDLPAQGISSIAINPSDPNIMYIGTGDYDSHVQPGYGVYKSTNGGYSWEEANSGMGNVYVSRLIIYPGNPNILIAATSDGIYKTFNSGLSWTKSNNIDGNVSDLEYKPGNLQIMYACADGVFYRSQDWGENWQNIIGVGHRSAIGVTPANPDKVYIFSERDGTAFRFYISDDSGLSFTHKIPNFTSDQGSFNLDITVDPNNENTIYVGMVELWKSTNAGDNWIETGTTPLHDDQHQLEWSPHNGYLYIANDGGIYYTPDSGNTYTDINSGLGIGMTHRLSTSKQNPDIMVIGQQDCGSFTTNGGTYYHEWGGDGMDCEIDPTSSNYIYVSDQHGPIARTTNGVGPSSEFHIIGGKDKDNGAVFNGVTESGGWLMPFQLHEDDPSVMFGCFNNVWKSTNVNTQNHNSVSWSKISNYNTDKVIEIFEKSPVDDDIMLIGRAKPWSLHMTLNGTSSAPLWSEISLPYPGASIGWIEAHQSLQNTFYICLSDSIYKTTDLGITWEEISGDLPSLTKFCILQQQGSNEHLYVATTFGVYYRDASMPEWEWQKFKSGVPTGTRIFHLDINYGTNPPQLFAGTWGRGVWKTEILTDQRPNLTATSGSVTIDGTQVDISLSAQNTSSFTDCDTVVIGFYLSDNPHISNNDHLLAIDTVSYWYPGVYVNLEHDIDLEYYDPPPPPGEYYIGSYIDPNDSIDETIESDNDITFSGQVTLDQPLIPQNLQASDGLFFDKIELDWDAPANPEGSLWYAVYRNTYNNPNTATRITSNYWIPETAWWDETAVPGVDYYYWIKASYNYLGYRPSAFCSYNKGWEKLGASSYIYASNGLYSDSVYLFWQRPEGATHSKLYRNESNNFNTATELFSTWIEGYQYYDAPLDQGSEYFYWVNVAMSPSGHHESTLHSDSDEGYTSLVDAPIVNATDGTYTDKVQITWNNVGGASYYRVYWNYTNDTITANALNYWAETTEAFHTNIGSGWEHYYWVKAAIDPEGNTATGFSTVETGWANFEPIENVQASDGDTSDFIKITWDDNFYAEYFRVYRSLNPIAENSEAVSEWLEDIPFVEFIDTTAIPCNDYFYWVKSCGVNPGELVSDFSEYNIGWRKPIAPAFQATNGVYTNKIVISWDSVPGAGAYRIYRSTNYSNIQDTLTEWTSPQDFEFDDLDVLPDVEYYYWIQASRNHYGYHPGDLSSHKKGMAGECGNLIEDPTYRSVNVVGHYLEITARVINEGPFDIPNPSIFSVWAFDDPDVYWDKILKDITIPPLDADEHYDVNVTVNLNDLGGLTLQYGTWYIKAYLPYDSDNCESNLNDNFRIWDNMSFEYTDALYGEYTIGGIDPDYENFSETVADLVDRGVSGGAIFQVRPEIYSEQISIPAIVGSSENNYIQFRTESGHTDTAEIYFSVTPDENYVVELNGASHIIFENIKITSPGFSNYQSTYGRCIEFKDNSNNILFEECRISGSSATGFQSLDQALIYAGNTSCNNITFDDNIIEKGYDAICFIGPSDGDDEIFEITISNNQIIGFIQTGIHLENQDNPFILGNLIQNSGISNDISRGIFLDNIENGLSVEKNNVIISMDTDEYYIRGFDFRYCKGTEETQGIIANNMLAIHSDATTTCSGFAFYRASNMGVYNNTVNISGAALENDYAMFIEGSSSDTYQNVEIINNVFSNMKGGFAVFYGHGAFLSNYVDVMDYNDIYSSEDYLIFHNQQDSITIIDEWYPLSGFGEHSVSCDPLYLSDVDLHVQSSGIDGVALPLDEVSVDIDGESRHPIHSDIGADEFMPPPLAYDLFVNDIISPETAYDLGDQELITLELYNVGANAISNFPVSYRINGGPKITENVTDTLENGNVFWYTFTTTADLSDIGEYIIVTQTELPNDLNGANDIFIDTIQSLLPYDCDPLYGMGCGGNSGIIDFRFGSFNHPGTGCSDDGFGDFTGIGTIYANQGDSYQMEIMMGYHDHFVSLWIDFNDNLIFENNEKLVSDFYCEFGNQTYSMPVDIPNSGLPGSHRMRVRAAWENSPVHPCNSYQWGEAHDYTVQIFPGGNLFLFPNDYYTNCPGTPVEVSMDFFGDDTPFHFLWNTGDTTQAILVSPMESTNYVLQITDNQGFVNRDTAKVFVSPAPDIMIDGITWLCPGDDLYLNGGGSAYGTMPEYCSSNCDMHSGYCTSGASNSDNAIIEEVKINEINNNTAGTCATYSDFTNQTATIIKGENYEMELTIGTCGVENTKGAKIFIDWNRDGDFNDMFENEMEAFPEDSTYTHYISLWIPEEAVAGNTLMRIVAVETWDTWSIPACGSYSYGETEDYNLNIVDTTANQIMAYNWTGPNGFTSTLQNPVINNVMVADSGYFHLMVSDGNNCSNEDSIFVVVQPDYNIFAGPDTAICEYDVYDVNATVDGWMPFTWETDGGGTFINGETITPTYSPNWEDIQAGSVEITLKAFPMTQCQDTISSSFTLTIQKLPWVELPAGEMICQGENYQLNGVVVHDALSYHWTTSGTGIYDDSTALNPKYFPSLADINNGFVDLYICMTGTAPCLADTNLIPLFIQRNPTVYAGEDTTICSNGSLSLLSAYASDFDSLKWFTTGTGSFIDKYMENTEYFPSEADIATGTVNLQLVGYPMMPCSDSVVSELALTIVEETFADAGGSGMICANETFFLSDATASGFNLLQWETTGTGSFIDPNSLNPEYLPGIDETGMVILTLTGFGTSPCGNVSSPFYLDIMPAPAAYAGENANIQSGDSYLLLEATATDYIMLEWSTDGSGTFDDQYMLNSTYFPGIGETGEVELMLTAYGNWPCDSVTSSLTLSVLGGYNLDIKVFLEGPFNGSSMDTDINSILPLSHPYGGAPWNYVGTESVGSIPNSNIIDWVFVELRDAPDAASALPATMIAQQAAFLLNDGSVVGMDGSSNLSFTNLITNSLFVVIKHRNHLGIISSTSLTESGGVYDYDFSITITQVYNGGAGYKEIATNIYGMAGGDADANGDINTADKTLWTNDVGTKGYKPTDHNMDVQVNNQDKNDTWVKNGSYSSQVPD